MLFVIGILAEAVLCILSLFIASIYSEDWGYASAFREKAYAVGSQNSFSLLSMYTWVYGLIISLVVAACIFYFVCFLLKKHVQLPAILLLVYFLLPLIMMFIGIGRLAQDGQYVQIAFITIGSGTHSGLTAFGTIYLFGSIAAYILICVGMFIDRGKQDAEAKRDVKAIKVKKKEDEQPIDRDDWKL